MKTRAEEKQKALVQWTLALFHKLFFVDMRSLIAENPSDKVDDDGEPFWGGSRRMPQPTEFDTECSWHLIFAAQSIRLVCRAFGLAQLQPLSSPDKPEQDPLIQRLRELLKMETQLSQSSCPLSTPEILSNLAPAIRHISQQCPEVLVGFSSEEFEKDDLSLGHVAFLTAASNIRCAVHKCLRLIRCRFRKWPEIVPAVATTTSLVAGLVALELVKVASGDVLSASVLGTGKTRSGAWSVSDIFLLIYQCSLSDEQFSAEAARLRARFRNSFVNLATPLLLLRNLWRWRAILHQAGRRVLDVE